jgi:hypothetical protein
MLRRLSLLVLAFVLLPLSAKAACDLQMSMTCSTGSCTATTVNNSNDSCAGTFITGFFAEVPPATVTLSGLISGTGADECFDDSLFGGQATEAFALCFGDYHLPAGASFTSTVSVKGGSSTTTLPIVGFTEVLDFDTEEEIGLAVAYNDFTAPTCTPTASVASQSQSGLDYPVSWSQVSNPQSQYQVDESTSSDFTANLSSKTVQGTSTTFRHTATSNTSYYYRVKATNCNGGPGPFSATVSTVVLAPVVLSSSSNDTNVVLPLGSTAPFSFTLTVQANAGDTFAATTDKPYLTVSPASGTVPSNGIINLTLTAGPSGLPPGASTATVNLTTPAPIGRAVDSRRAGTNAVTTVSTPVSVTLVTPVGPSTKTQPPSSALIIPVVTHVVGSSALFESDVRLTNASASATNYQITLTPANTDGTKTSKATQVTVGASQTIALNDIAQTLFGLGGAGQPTSGSLEIRALNASGRTFASSRTYATTPNGTFGQFIAAIPFSAFASNLNPLPIPGGPVTNTTVLSLQQVSQSAKFRTNLGLVEGSGAAASGVINIYNDAGTKLKTVPFSLQPGEQKQFGNFISDPSQGNTATLDDGRLEVVVQSATGAVSAYASVLDNVTSDPLAVAPAQPTTISATRYVVPGIADLPGTNNFHSDVRIFNGGSTTANVTATYYPQGGGTPVAAVSSISVGPNEIKPFDNILPGLFNVTGSGGAIVLTTSSPSSLVTTARTYTNADGGGTFGQFIPGVTSTEGVGAGERALQILQLEQSPRFRSNVGLSELTGNPAHVKLTLYAPDKKIDAVKELDLGPNQFFQLGSIFASIYPGEAIYNGRVTVEVTTGSGRVTAYGSVIDNRSLDPTYVPAQ